MSQADLSEGIDRIFPTAAVGDERRMQPQAGAFQSFMEGSPAGGAQAPLISPFDLGAAARPIPQGADLDALLAQVNLAQGTIGDMQGQLNTPGLHLRESDRYILNNKLEDTRTTLRSTSENMGAKPRPDTPTEMGMSPIGRFLTFLGDGNVHLEEAKGMIQELQKKGDQMNPADFLLVQIKVNKAQQQLDFSSILLSKAVDGIKTMMQIQI